MWASSAEDWCESVVRRSASDSISDDDGRRGAPGASCGAKYFLLSAPPGELGAGRGKQGEARGGQGAAARASALIARARGQVGRWGNAEAVRRMGERGEPNGPGEQLLGVGVVVFAASCAARESPRRECARGGAPTLQPLLPVLAQAADSPQPLRKLFVLTRTSSSSPAPFRSHRRFRYAAVRVSCLRGVGSHRGRVQEVL